MSFYLVLLFWLSLALPGYAVLRHLRVGLERPGILAAIALSYLASFVILSPVSLLAYLFRLPVWVFSTSVVALVLLATVWLSFADGWRAIGRTLRAALVPEAAVLLVYLWMCGRAGGYIGIAGDAIFHIGRIRALVDHGLSNQDFYLATDQFIGPYHSNIYHALIAAASQLSGVDVPGTWRATLPWAQLVRICGAYFLGWTLVRQKWGGWLAALLQLLLSGHVRYGLYPNQVGPGWLLPMGIAFTVSLARGGRGYVWALGVGAISLVLGQVHALFAAFLGMSLAPYLLVRGAWCAPQSKSWKRPEWLALVCLCAALPFALATKIPDDIVGDSTSTAQGSGVSRWDPEELSQHDFDMVDSGLMHVLWTKSYVLVLVAVVLLAVFKRRHASLVLLSSLIPMLVIFHFPPLTANLVSLVGAPWILNRGFSVIHVLQVGATSSSAFLLLQWIRDPLARSWASIALSVLVLQFWAPLHGRTSWGRFTSDAFDAKERRTGRLRYLRGFEEFLKEHIPAGSVVLSDRYTARKLAMVHDVHVLQAAGGHHGLTEQLEEQRKALGDLYDDKTRWKEAKRHLEKYGIEYVVTQRGREQFQWKKGHVREMHKYDKGRYLIFKFALD